MRLKNKVAVITGGASGFGEGIVKKFLEEGAKVILADINYDLAQQVVSNLSKEVIPFKADVSKGADTENMIRAAVENFGKIDILVQNAAIGMKPKKLTETSEDEFDRLFNINVKSVYLGAKKVI